MDARLDFKNKTTLIKLSKMEAKNNRLVAGLAVRGARYKKETSKFVWYEAPGNIMPILL